MEKKEFFTVEIKDILSRLENESEELYPSKSLALKIFNFIQKLQDIEPDNKNTDNTWNLWIKSSKGDISSFWNYEEMLENCDVENHEEYVRLWEDDFPHEYDWHEFTVIEYKQTYYFYLESKFLFRFNLEDNTIIGIHPNYKELARFVARLLVIANKEIHIFLKNPDKYNLNIATNLPLWRRYGKIKRKIIWENISDEIRYDHELGNEKINKLELLVANNDENLFFEKMTVNDFLRYCEICYDSNNYFKDSKAKLSPLEKYKKMADSRHGGLLNIKPDSSTAFKKWYVSGEWRGTHPWEICRGGNSTHITLHISKYNDGWKLYLTGLFRQVETINMAIALFEQLVPFVFYDKTDMLNMAKGEDNWGVVPENVIPKYCHSFFPKEDNVIDFLNPWHYEDIRAVVEKHATWYPEKKICKSKK
jgi:hypothetical protein